MPLKKTRTFANVWDALEDSREDAATMTMRSNVMIAIKDQVRSWNTTQAQAARQLGITQPRLNDLLHGKINKSGTLKVRIYAASPHGNCETVGDLKPPERRHNGAVIRDSVKEAADLLRCLVAVDPGKRRRTVEHKAHGRP